MHDPWRGAACRGADPALFDAGAVRAGHIPPRARGAAATYCAPCPIRAACRAYALDAAREHLVAASVVGRGSSASDGLGAVLGVWGGLYLGRGSSGTGRLTVHDVLTAGPDGAPLPVEVPAPARAGAA